MSPTRDHIPALDGLRGLAVLMVLISHLLPTGNWWIAQHGGLGVDIFFVLSGFLITRILLFNHENGILLRTFLWRRALRIFPPYYALLLIVALIRQSGDGWIFAITYTYNFTEPSSLPGDLGHTWSLCIEEHFYMLWPLVVMFLPLGKSRHVCLHLLVYLALATFLVEQIAFAWGWGNRVGLWMFQWTPFRAPSLLVGCWLAYGEKQWRGRPRSIVVGMVLLLLSFILTTFGLPIDHSGLFIENASRLMVAAAMFLLAISILQRVYATEPLRWIGRISYGLYLYHLLIYSLVGNYGGHDVTKLIAVFAFASLSYYFFELPIMRRGRRFMKPTPSVASSATEET